MKNLFVNVCVRKESRTKKLADALLDRLPGEYREIVLAEAGLMPLTEETLDKRTALIQNADFDDKMFDPARQFKEAEQIVIAAPYWDLSFPALLKIYIEQIMVQGLTFSYSAEGFPVSLCDIKRIFYVSTAGGPVMNGNEGFQYIKQVGEAFFNVGEIKLIQAENLDIIGNDPESIIAEKINNIKLMQL